MTIHSLLDDFQEGDVHLRTTEVNTFVSTCEVTSGLSSLTKGNIVSSITIISPEAIACCTTACVGLIND
jgi:hypothetical protein